MKYKDVNLIDDKIVISLEKEELNLINKHKDFLLNNNPDIFYNCGDDSLAFSVACEMYLESLEFESYKEMINILLKVKNAN